MGAAARKLALYAKVLCDENAIRACRQAHKETSRLAAENERLTHLLQRLQESERAVGQQLADKTQELQQAEERLAKRAELATNAPDHDAQRLRTRAEKAEAAAGANVCVDIPPPAAHCDVP